MTVDETDPVPLFTIPDLPEGGTELASDEAVALQNQIADLTALLVRPAPGVIVETGLKDDDGRDILRIGVGDEAHGSVPNEGFVTIAPNAHRLLEVDVIARFAKPAGSYQSPLPWFDYDSELRWATVEVDDDTHDLVISGNLGGFTVAEWWGSVRYTER